VSALGSLSRALWAIPEGIRLAENGLFALQNQIIEFVDVLVGPAVGDRLVKETEKNRYMGMMDYFGTADKFSKFEGLGNVPKGAKGGGSSIDWTSIAATGIGALAGGGGAAGVMQAVLPAIGMAIGGPIGGAIGGLLGGLFGRKKPRGETKSYPLFMYQVNPGDVATAFLNIFKGRGAFAGGMSINDINAAIKGQGVTLGLSG